MTNEEMLLKFSEKDLSVYNNISNLFDMSKIVMEDNPELAISTLRQLNDRARYEVIRGKEVSITQSYYEIVRKSALVLAPLLFEYYMLFVEFEREARTKFYLPRQKVMKPLTQDLQDLYEKKLDLLSLSMPPGTGKSTLGIFFLSWIMGKHPDQPNLASAHGDKLTRSFYDGVNSIVKDPEYLWSDVFPNVVFESCNAKDETINFGKPKRFKTLTCRSIDGSLTGNTRCERILYADDLVSGIEEALNINRLDTLWFKVVNDLLSRMKQGCGQLHIATRWSLHDPIGRLQKKYDGNPRYKFVELAALDENDESNFDYMYNVGYNTSTFHGVREIMDDISWRCLYMNHPIEREGLLYSPDELRRFYELPDRAPDAILSICDTADGGGDDVFLPVMYLYGEDSYCVDCVLNDGTPTITDPLCAEMLIKHKVQQCQFESNSAGGRTADKVEEIIKKKGCKTHITKKFTTGNKETKIIVNSTYVKEHLLFKNPTEYKPNSPYGKMMNKLCAYTVKGKNPHDDVPDGLAQYAIYVQNLKGQRVDVFKRPF